MKGFEQVEIMRPGYAIEYDFVEPMQLKPTLETRVVDGLYHAGQINGTSGYEEAAGQGLLAASMRQGFCQGKEPILIGRDQGYLGVMIDDLVTQPTTDPYRMFTSRAEYRLLLREDNADQRLTPLGREVGLVADDRWKKFVKKQEDVKSAQRYMSETVVTSTNREVIDFFSLGELKSGLTLAALLLRPEIEIDKMARCFDGLQDLNESALEQIEIAIKYEGYIQRQKEQVERFREYEDIIIPDTLIYDEVPNLSAEVREKLGKIKPVNLGQAGRIQGVTPAAVAVLHIYLRKMKNEKKAL